MPRKRQTRSGHGAQKIASVPGQRYGEGVAQQQMQRAMPAPHRSDAPTPAVPPSPGGAPAPGTAPAGVDPALVQQWLAQHNPAMLAASSRPNEPVTAGLPTGPGPGPSPLGAVRTPLGRFLRTLHDQTGDPTFKRLAERAGL